MTDIAIRVENLGKKYQLGGQKSGSFRESLLQLFRAKGGGRQETGQPPANRFPAPCFQHPALFGL